MILIIAITILIRFCKDWTDNSQAVRGSGYQFASVRNSSVRQFCELSLNSCQIQWKGSLLFINKILKPIHLMIIKLWISPEIIKRWIWIKEPIKEELFDCDNLERSFSYYSHDQHWKNDLRLFWSMKNLKVTVNSLQK